MLRRPFYKRKIQKLDTEQKYCLLDDKLWIHCFQSNIILSILLVLLIKRGMLLCSLYKLKFETDEHNFIHSAYGSNK